ncbi:MAG: hypothetical protein K2Q32_09135 [Alphaproteobacteria bacterium]|nr:hypothetical protein [Alphaproteobacteria bacterium]
MIRKRSAAITRVVLATIKAKSSAGVFAIATDLLIIFFIVFFLAFMARRYESLTLKIITHIFESNGPQFLKTRSLSKN